jgi:hypothetical protein
LLRYHQYFILFSTVCIAVFANTVLAEANSDSISRADLDYFLEESYSSLDEAESKKDWEDYLYQAAQGGKNPAATIDLFASKIGFDVEAASVIADAIIEIVRFDDRCSYSREEQEYDCRFENGAPAYDKFIEANSLDQSGELAFIVGKFVGSEYDTFEWRKRFLKIVVEHPGRVLTFRRMLDYTRDDLWIFALAATGEIDVSAAKLIFLRQYYGSMYEASNWNGGSMALLEALSKHQVDPETRSLLAFALVSLQMHTGLNDMAISTFRRLPRDIRNFVPPPDESNEKYDGDRLFENFTGFKVDLAATLFEQKHASSARRMLKDIISASSDFSEVKYGIKARAAALDEIISPRLNRRQVFDYFIHGRQPDDPEIKEHGLSLLAGPGWLFQVEGGGPAFRSIAAAYLQEREFDGMSKYLQKRSLYQRSRKGDGLIDELLPLLPDNFVKRKAYWRERIDSAWGRHKTGKRTKTKQMAAEASPAIVKPKIFAESVLPEGLQTTEADPDFKLRMRPEVPESIQLPIDAYQLVRYAEEKGERQIIYFSSALDAPGEIPAYGYWFQQTKGQGEAWDDPIYLGLQQHFPYIIVARSKLALLSEDGLNIEVEAREIDPSSITFPPVGLSLMREERNLFLSISLQDLVRDSDDDGLTDLVEFRLQMDAYSADTDSDGLTDSRDPLPLTAFDAQAPLPKKELAYAILSILVGYERQSIVVSPRSPGAKVDLLDILGAERAPNISDGGVFLKADPELFAGVRTPFRLFIFSEEEIDRINSSGAPFYPAEVQAIFSRPGGTEYYVIWSAIWTGGKFIVRCQAGKCETEVTSQWVT